MRLMTKSTILTALGAVLFLSAESQAQLRVLPGATGGSNPVIRVNANLLALQQQAALNNAVIGRALTAQAVRARAIQAAAIRRALITNPYVGNPFLGNPYLGNPYTGVPPLNPYAAGRLTSVNANPYTVNPGVIDPYGGLQNYGGFYGNPYGITIPNPYEGYARGVSGVIDAQGMYAIRYQQARLLNQQVEQAKIATRKAIFDEWRHERMYTPTYQERLDKKREAQVIRARRNPPLTEILSGDSLNALLDFIQKKLAAGGLVPEVPVDAEVLNKINVTTGRGGNIALLRDEGKLTWPIGLRKEQFDKWRDLFSNKAPEAVRQAEVTGKVDAEFYAEMQACLKALRAILNKSVGTMSFSEYTQALKYLNLCDDAMTALQDPEVSNYFTRKFSANGKDVLAVVKNMTNNGLKFAAATPADTAAYRRFHGLLATLADALDRPQAKR